MEEHRVERFNIGAFCIINPTAINTIIVFIEGGREMTTREGGMKVFGIRREEGHIDLSQYVFATHPFWCKTN